MNVWIVNCMRMQSLESLLSKLSFAFCRQKPQRTLWTGRKKQCIRLWWVKNCLITCERCPCLRKLMNLAELATNKNAPLQLLLKQANTVTTYPYNAQIMIINLKKIHVLKIIKWKVSNYFSCVKCNMNDIVER